MNFKATLIVLLSLTLTLISCETEAADEFDDGVTVEDENEPLVTSEIEQKVQYISPYPDVNKFYFAEHFDDLKRFEAKWTRSEAKKDDISEEIAKYDGVWSVELPQRSILNQDLGLVLKSKAKHAAISSKLNRPFKFAGKPLVVQYEVTLQDGQECGGSYLKLLSAGSETNNLAMFNDKTPYTIMVGPDKCGNDIKLHFIFRHVNPMNGTIEEKHCKKPKERIEEPFKDKQPHLYKLIINPDNTFEISVDHKVINEGHLLKDFTPSVNPPKEVDDPTDFKPESWDEREKIPDPTAVKPDGWDVAPEIQDPNAIKPENWLDDEEEMIEDTSAEKPKDWDNEMDGVWEPPLIKNPLCENNGCGEWKAAMIANPEYKGKWRAPLIDNPNYQGKWSPRRILNPHFFEDDDPFSRLTPISAVGIELWSMSNDILFDNIIITDDEAHAIEWASQTYDLKRKHLDKQANTFWERMMRHMNYKPGYYLTYFIYCMIPVSIYVWYLCRRRNEDKIEESFVQKMKNIANENPWIIALLVVVIGLPISIILYMLCSSSPRKADSKKTDEATADDTYDTETPARAASEKRSKVDLNEPEPAVLEDDEAEAQEESIGETQQPVEEEIPEEPFEEVKTRKRKPRKD